MKIFSALNFRETFWAAKGRWVREEILSLFSRSHFIPIPKKGNVKEYSIYRTIALISHVSILTWRIPWTEELGGLQSTGRKQSDTTEQLHFTHYSNFSINKKIN